MLKILLVFHLDWELMLEYYLYDLLISSSTNTNEDHKYESNEQNTRRNDRQDWWQRYVLRFQVNHWPKQYPMDSSLNYTQNDHCQWTLMLKKRNIQRKVFDQWEITFDILLVTVLFTAVKAVKTLISHRNILLSKPPLATCSLSFA